MQISLGKPSAKELKQFEGSNDDNLSQEDPNPRPPPELELPLKPEQIKFSTSNKSEYQLDQDEYKPDEGFTKLDFETPVDLLLFFDEKLNREEVHLYGWQLEVGEMLGTVKSTSLDPLQYCLCAANGSGKDLYVIAPFVIWFACCKIKSLCVITSSSGTQLTSQTENYIRMLAEKINYFFVSQGQSPIFRIKQRYIKCLISGSQIRLFVTDEAGKAEGYHPLEPNREMAIIENEAKSIPDEIDSALERCTGYNYFLKVSTPGEPIGHFYYAFTNWLSKRRVTAFECPNHLSLKVIEQHRVRYGEFSPFYRSKVLALFTSIDSTVVIPQEVLEKCKLAKPQLMHQEWPLRVGIDLAIGGDEIVCCIWRGNKRLEQYTFKETDSTITADLIDKWLDKWKLPKNHEYIRADDGGVGRAIIDQIVRKGWNIKRVLNQWPARNKREFRNRGAELYFQFSRLVQECIIIIPENDDELEKQLTTRYYKKGDQNGVMQLQSKAEAKSEGRPSPDRADATVLAFSDLTILDFISESANSDTNSKSSVIITQGDHIVSVESIVKSKSGLEDDFKYFDNKTKTSGDIDPYKGYDDYLKPHLAKQPGPNSNGRLRASGSLSSILFSKRN